MKLRMLKPHPCVLGATPRLVELSGPNEDLAKQLIKEGFAEEVANAKPSNNTTSRRTTKSKRSKTVAKD